MKDSKTKAKTGIEKSIDSEVDSEPRSASSAGANAVAKTARSATLDDVMIAMDVVDTLRHDERIAKRELNDGDRRADLIRRLREIYKGQGIEVTDAMLEEGVKALEEERFAYNPPEGNWRVRLANLYVTRDGWGRWVVGAITGIMIVSASWYMMIERPRTAKVERMRVELSQTLPAEMKTLAVNIERETRLPEVIKAASALRDDGLAAAKSGDGVQARKSAKTLRDMLVELRVAYQVKIVARKGQLSGLWRIPQVNPTARNYYLIVEALSSDGEVLPRTMTNEETGKRETVKTWALRVPRSVLNNVQADKADDGIIQNAVVGEKRRGELAPTWLVEVSGGVLTRW